MTDDRKENAAMPAASRATVEPRDASWLVTSTTALGVVVGLLLALVMAGGMFWIGAFYLEQSPASPAVGKQTVRELRAADESELTSYGWVNQKEGTVRIPVDRAMELLVNEAARDAGPLPKPPAN